MEIYAGRAERVNAIMRYPKWIGLVGLRDRQQKSTCRAITELHEQQFKVNNLQTKLFIASHQMLPK
jgi:predicted CoA-binding protein